MEDDIKRLGELLRGNEALSAAVADLVARSTDVDLEYFYEEIDRSNYSLEDWASALVAFDRWIEGQGKVERPFRAMVGYLHCCTLTTADSVGVPSLEVVLDQSLKNYGFESI